jgi:hypothetical protein
MRLENMRDGETCFTRHLNINLNVGSWIEDRPHTFFVVAEQVRKFGDAFGLNCFKNERHGQTLGQREGEHQQYRASHVAKL